jgi:hypothetical protein
MADKRNSVAGKVATPNLKVGGGLNKDVIDADSNLYKAVGSRYVASFIVALATTSPHTLSTHELTSRSIKITCAPTNNVLEGTLFTACNLTNAIAINTASAPSNPSVPPASQPGDFHILSFEIVGSAERAPEAAPGFDAAVPSISKVDIAALQAREEHTIREMKKKDAQKGKGVSKEAQELFDAIARTYVYLSLSLISEFVVYARLMQMLACRPAGQTHKSSSTTRSSFSPRIRSTASRRPRIKRRARRMCARLWSTFISARRGLVGRRGRR